MSDWDELVHQGQRLAETDRGGAAFALGDLALAIAPVGKEGINTGGGDDLRKYAEAIGVPFNTLQQYRRVSAHWPANTRVLAVPHVAHRLLMGEPDRAELIRNGCCEPKAIRALLAERHPKVAPKPETLWWEAEKEAARLFIAWNERRMLRNWSTAEKRRAVALIRAHIKREEEVASTIEAASITHKL